MAASDPTTRTAGRHDTLTATSVDSDRRDSERPESERRESERRGEDWTSAFGEDIPTEEGGMLAMTGWSMVAAAVGLTAIALVVTLMLRRRWGSRRAAREAAHETQHAVIDFLDRSRRETRRLGRRIAEHLPAEAAA